MRSVFLKNFRNYQELRLEFGHRPIVLIGPNGAGKTNLLEALSLLAPGRGLRRAARDDFIYQTNRDENISASLWAVSARLESKEGPIEAGTGLNPERPEGARIVKVNGAK